MSLALVQSKVDAANRTHVAREVGVTREHVSQILSGKKEPSFPVAAKLAKGLGITLDEFYRCWVSVREAA
jgi:transcriptional regulator with XRE-family HTH domain